MAIKERLYLHCKHSRDVLSGRTDSGVRSSLDYD
jgi:hypothetical protein